MNLKNHPCIITQNGVDRLEILVHLYNDQTTPKCISVSKILDTMKTNKYEEISFSDFSDDDIKNIDALKKLNLNDNQIYFVISQLRSRNDSGKIFEHLNYIDDQIKNERSKGKIASFMDRLFSPDNDKKINKTFDDIKKTILNYSLIDSKLGEASKVYELQYARAVSTGQKFLAEKLTSIREVVMAEILLLNNGYKHFIPEEKIISFLNRCSRSVRLDFLNHYVGLIPDDVVSKKIAADNLYVFDNYCVMYYSDKIPAFKATRSEKELMKRKKDPILFGMIKGSSKLYYIADWITENDDLTIDKFYQIIGEEKHDVSDTVEVEEIQERINSVISNILPSMK